MDELALEPERGAGVGEMRPRDPAVADRARSQPLVETRERVLGARKRPRELAPRQRIGKASAQGEASDGGLERSRIAHEGLCEIFAGAGSKHSNGSKRCRGVR